MQKDNLSTDESIVRLQKLQNFKDNNVLPYPAKVKRGMLAHDAQETFKELEKTGKKIKIQGRIKTLRVHGGLAFLTLEDGSGLVQIALQKKNLKEYKLYTSNLDLGDFIEVTGPMFLTKKGEKTLNAQSIRLLAKSILPLPEKWHGLSDVEIRYRQRYLDLATNPEVRNIFIKRGLIVKAIRSVLDDNGFLEVETPILQAIPGGATAKPFKTHHNALNTDLYLRIAPELYLKRLLVGGYEKVYEIARCFRNEGIDHSHNPEFTQVEFYWAYSEYEELMKFTEKLLTTIGKSISKKLEFEFDGKKFSLKPPFKKITFKEAIYKTSKIDIDKITNKEELAKKAKDIGVKVGKGDSYGKILDEIFKKKFRATTFQPTFIVDYPLELSPLAKKKDGSNNTVERFQLIIAGMEVCNAFSELNDPLDQEQRFKSQEKARKEGDEEAQRMDKDYITALSHGMPPASGFGMGIDRLTMLLTNNHSIKEVILFPTLKPEK